MKKLAFLAAVAAMGLCGSAMAMTGPLVDGEPAWNDADFSTLAPISSLHDETVNNPNDIHKGWWWVNISNNTGVAWSAIDITPGAEDLVAIVQGTNLEDEWSFVGNSVVANKAGSMSYSGSYGTRTYNFPTTGQVTGDLWSGATFTFATPLASGEKVGLKIYTDNSYYAGPYADSFSIVLTPVAVPEPGAFAVLALGGLALLRRRH